MARSKLNTIVASWVAILGATTASITVAAAAPSDRPQDYSHLLPLTMAAKQGAAMQGVIQLRLPRDVYLHAHSPQLDDVRVFDANGVVQPFALRTPAPQASTSHRSLPLVVFPLMDGGGNAASQLDLDVSTAPDGRLLSVRVRPDQGQEKSAQAARLSGLILDLGKNAAAAPLIDGLRFTLPANRHEYSAQVWLETSEDLKHWDTVGAAELNWLVSQDAQTLANDRLAFDARRFRYARLSWRSGTPLRFAAVTAEQLVQTDAAPHTEQLVVPPAPGRQPQDLVYATPLALAPSKAGLQFGEANVVLAATLGTYRELPARQIGQAGSWRFEPLLNSTFYRITQGGQVRSSGDLEVAPVHTTQWVLRMAAPNAARPALRLSWEPATMIFLASGSGPYTLAVGRDGAAPAAREVAQVAPGFNAAELQSLEQASAGPAQAQQGSAAAGGNAVLEAAAAAQRRLVVLWGVLLLGVAVLAFMVWRLLKSQQKG